MKTTTRFLQTDICESRKSVFFHKLRMWKFRFAFDSAREITDLIRYQKLHILGRQFMDGGAGCLAGERTSVGF